jgi:transcription elongation factor GreB
MSRAFAPGESEDDEERFVVKAPVLPPNTPNFITPRGAERLSAEKARLVEEKSAIGDSVESKQRLKALDQRLAFVTERLQTITLVNPATQPRDRVAFGARVTITDAEGKEQTWTIAGIDEVDLDQGIISWISPLAKSLADKKPGDSITIAGQTYTVKKIDY